MRTASVIAFGFLVCLPEMSSAKRPFVLDSPACHVGQMSFPDWVTSVYNDLFKHKDCFTDNGTQNLLHWLFEEDTKHSVSIYCAPPKAELFHTDATFAAGAMNPDIGSGAIIYFNPNVPPVDDDIDLVEPVTNVNDVNQLLHSGCFSDGRVALIHELIHAAIYAKGAYISGNYKSLNCSVGSPGCTRQPNETFADEPPDEGGASGTLALENNYRRELNLCQRPAYGGLRQPLAVHKCPGCCECIYSTSPQNANGQCPTSASCGYQVGSTDAATVASCKQTCMGFTVCPPNPDINNGPNGWGAINGLDCGYTGLATCS